MLLEPNSKTITYLEQYSEIIDRINTAYGDKRSIDELKRDIEVILQKHLSGSS